MAIRTALLSLVAVAAVAAATPSAAQTAQTSPPAKPPAQGQAKPPAAQPAKPAASQGQPAGQAQKPAAAPAQPAAQAAKPAAAQRPGVPGIHPLAQAAAGAGAVECVGQMSRVSNFLTTNAQNGALLFLNPAEGAQRLTSASYEISAKDVLAYGSATFAPVVGGGCQAVYESIVYWEKSCADVAKTAFPTLKAQQPILKDIGILADPSTLRVFLMPAGKGCVSIKKDLVL